MCLSIIALLISMACRALVHNLLHHFFDTDKKFNMEDQWWNPAISWLNKRTVKWTIDIFNWRVAKFPIPVQASDAFHLFNTIELGAYAIIISILIPLWLGLMWYFGVGVFIITGVILMPLFFNLGYDRIFR